MRAALPLSLMVVATVVTGGAQAAETSDGTGLAEPVFYPAGEKPWSVTHADFNGDGTVDVATANGSNTLSVLMGNGDGTYREKAGYTAPEAPYFLGFDVVAADFNGDKKPDLAWAGGNPVGTAMIYLNNGDGTFGEPKLREFGFGPNAVAAADVNGDGKQDLLTANNFAGDVSVGLGKGDGTFGKEQKFKVGPGPQGLTIGDVNGDDIVDIVTGNFGRVEDSVSVLIGRGDGSFEEAQNYAAGIAVNDAVIGDFNNDGIADIAAGEFVVNKVSVLLGKPGGGYQDPKEYKTGSSINEMDVADFNGDGTQDIVTSVSPDSNRNPSEPPPPDLKGAGLSVLFSNGDGSFREGTLSTLTEGLMASAAAVDVNADNRVDVVSANLTKNSLVVWINSGNQR